MKYKYVSQLYPTNADECWLCEGERKIWMDQGYTLCPICSGLGYVPIEKEKQKEKELPDKKPSNILPVFGVGAKFSHPEYGKVDVLQLSYLYQQNEPYYTNLSYVEAWVSVGEDEVLIACDKETIRKQQYILLEDFWAAEKC